MQNHQRSPIHHRITASRTRRLAPRVTRLSYSTTPDRLPRPGASASRFLLRALVPLGTLSSHRVWHASDPFEPAAGGTYTRFHLWPGHADISFRTPFHSRPIFSFPFGLSRREHFQIPALSVTGQALLEASGFAVLWGVAHPTGGIRPRDGKGWLAPPLALARMGLAAPFSWRRQHTTGRA